MKASNKISYIFVFFSFMTAASFLGYNNPEKAQNIHSVIFINYIYYALVFLLVSVGFILIIYKTSINKNQFILASCYMILFLWAFITRTELSRYSIILIS